MQCRQRRSKTHTLASLERFLITFSANRFTSSSAKLSYSRRVVQPTTASLTKSSKLGMMWQVSWLIRIFHCVRRFLDFSLCDIFPLTCIHNVSKCEFLLRMCSLVILNDTYLHNESVRETSNQILSIYQTNPAFTT